MGDGKDTLQNVTRHLGMLSGLLVMVLGVVHVANKNAYVEWPKDGFAKDWNWEIWRLRLFSLHPDLLADNWTPVVMGSIALLMHFRSFNVRTLSSSFIRFFFFHFIMALFAAIGYEGGLGILISIFPLLTALLSLITYFVKDDHADLNYRYKVWEGQDPR